SAVTSTSWVPSPPGGKSAPPLQVMTSARRGALLAAWHSVAASGTVNSRTRWTTVVVAKRPGNFSGEDIFSPTPPNSSWQRIWDCVNEVVRIDSGDERTDA